MAALWPKNGSIRRMRFSCTISIIRTIQVACNNTSSEDLRQKAFGIARLGLYCDATIYRNGWFSTVKMEWYVNCSLSHGAQ
jgi:hypothetical protein